MMSTVASEIAPARAETPIARPSAKLWTPIAAAIVSPVRSARRREASSANASASDTLSAAASAPPAIGGVRALSGRILRSIIASPALPAAKPTPSSTTSQMRYAGGLVMGLHRRQRVVDDRQPVREHVDEDEREHPDGEHRERDPGPAAEQLEPAHREPEVDREAGERAEEDCLSEGHGYELGNPKRPSAAIYHVRWP